MITFREFIHAFREVGLNPGQPVIVHASLAAIGDIRGGVETLLGALLSMSEGVMAPTFTYKTMIIPEVGPENNACDYGSGKDVNRMAEFYRPDMPADPMMGVLPEAIRKYPGAKRSNHPLLSFSGIHVDEALKTQTLQEPMAPIGVLARQDAIVLLIGVNHTVNTSIHYAEYLAGRKQFIRWALTPQGVRECPGFGGCSDGFEQAATHLERYTVIGQVGSATLRAIQLRPMIQTLSDLIQEQPLALLCGKADARCESVRRSLRAPLILETEESPGD